MHHQRLVEMEGTRGLTSRASDGNGYSVNSLLCADVEQHAQHNTALIRYPNVNDRQHRISDTYHSPTPPDQLMRIGWQTTGGLLQIIQSAGQNQDRDKPRLRYVRSVDR